MRQECILRGSKVVDKRNFYYPFYIASKIALTSSLHLGPLESWGRVFGATPLSMSTCLRGVTCKLQKPARILVRNNQANMRSMNKVINKYGPRLYPHDVETIPQ